MGKWNTTSRGASELRKYPSRAWWVRRRSDPLNFQAVGAVATGRPPTPSHVQDILIQDNANQSPSQTQRSATHALRVNINAQNHSQRQNNQCKRPWKHNTKGKENRTGKRKHYIQTKINKPVLDDSPSMPTKGCSPDQGTGDLPVQIDDEETLRILSKNPRGFCFEEGQDYNIMAWI